MKDLPHHIQKLNRRIIRDAHREELSDNTIETNALERHLPQGQIRKQEKIRQAKKRKEHIPHSYTPEEQNKLQAKRNPVFFSKNHQKPKTTRATRKKTPRIAKGRKAA
ncbi:MAG TPA: hypothetical protein VLE96_04895 [Chlamydiales bacterium]|nr:hypothetical protein [Chlamydiales bacterium]